MRGGAATKGEKRFNHKGHIEDATQHEFEVFEAFENLNLKLRELRALRVNHFSHF